MHLPPNWKLTYYFPVNITETLSFLNGV
jgi:hypothetical protein